MQFEYRSIKMTKELEHDDLSETAETGKMHNITSKAGRLAMELSAEKKRLAQELEELQGEYDDIKPLTPTGTRAVSYTHLTLPTKA